MLGRLLDLFYLNRHPEGEVPLWVRRGVGLLYVAFVIQMVNNWLEGLRPIEFIMHLLFAGYIVFATGEGRKWARIVVLVFTIINVISFIWAAVIVVGKKPELQLTPVVLSLFLAEIAIETAATVMLFSKSAGVWFNRPRVAL